MSDNRYRSFIPKEDNAGQIISAEDINELQEAISEQARENFRQDDAIFLDTALFTLLNHVDVNAIMVELFENNARINFSKSTGVTFHPESRSVIFDELNLEDSVLVTTALTNPNEGAMRKLVLMIGNVIKSESVTMTYEYSYDGGFTYKPISPNQNEPVIALEEEVSSAVTLRITVRRPDTTEEVRLDSWALLYEDETYLFRFLDDGLDIDIEDGWDGTIVG